MQLQLIFGYYLKNEPNEEFPDGVFPKYVTTQINLSFTTAKFWGIILVGNWSLEQ